MEIKSDIIASDEEDEPQLNGADESKTGRLMEKR